ncbi:MAG: ParA family protein [Ignavibacteria bacterium]|nr:ParA family protein [Ignavibacteria bacterium]
MAKTISLINMKGGVGKSTLTVNLAWHFAAYSQWRKKVLVVDLDPQFNASQYLLGVTQYSSMLERGDQTVWDIFESNTRIPGRNVRQLDASTLIQNVITLKNGGVVDLIPSRLELAFSLKNPGHKERQLSKFLYDIKDSYDLILIDCAPTESILTTAAYLSSDYLLVPVKPEYLSSIGLPLLVNSMQDFRKEYDQHNLRLAGVVFNATSEYSPEERLSKNGVRSIASQNGWHIFKSEVSYSRSYPKGAREGQPIFRTSYSRYSQVSKFESFAKEFAIRISL